MSDLAALDHAHLWHPFTHMQLWLEREPLIITDAVGFELIASDGRRYIDANSSLWCNVHGHRVPELDAAISAQLERVAHTTLLGLSNEPAIRLAAKLATLTQLPRCFFTDAGACATEAACKMAVQFWWNQGRSQKRKFIGLAEGYHGDTVGAMSVGRSAPFQRPFAPMMFAIEMVESPATQPRANAAKLLANIERVLEARSDDIAAIILEPLVQAAAGMFVQPTGFLCGVRALCDRFDVLLIADEIATGFGRTGELFACEVEDVLPDLMCLGKGLTGGYLPLAAVMASERVFQTFVAPPGSGKTFFHGHTFTGNPLACAVALASIDLIDREGLVSRVQANAVAAAALLQQMIRLPNVHAVRQQGLMIGIELRDNTGRPFDPQLRIGAALCDRLRARGMILRPLGDAIVVMPAPAMPWLMIERVLSCVHEEIAAMPSWLSSLHPSATPVEVSAGDF